MIGKCTIELCCPHRSAQRLSMCLRLMLRQRRMTFGGSLIASLPVAFRRVAIDLTPCLAGLSSPLIGDRP